MPAAAGRGDRVGDVGRADGGGRAGGAPPASRLWAPNEIRVMPAPASAAGVAALVGPGVGLERDLGVGGEAEPLADRASSSAATSSAGRRDGVPPPR